MIRQAEKKMKQHGFGGRSIGFTDKSDLRSALLRGPQMV